MTPGWLLAIMATLWLLAVVALVVTAILDRRRIRSLEERVSMLERRTL